MSAAGRNVPLSPVSLGGSDWSLSKYPSRSDSPFQPFQPTPGNLASPPFSGGFNAVMMANGFSSGPRSNGGPSPPPSVGRSSTGTNIFSGGSDGDRNRNSTRDLDEPLLNEHYIALKAFLHARGSDSRQQPNKARDKLLRLSAVQFFELSTDVFDELIRRQAMARAPPNTPNSPPQFLLPEKTFHQKRNQARQRLASLGPPRFRDLATDVYHELERRFPHFVGRDIPREGSAMSMRNGVNGRNGNPPNGMFPPRGPSRIRRPSDASSIRGVPPPPDVYGIPPSPSLPNGDFGRPMPRQLNQSNTIVPIKSTMLEEDEDSGIMLEADKRIMEEYQAQIRELQDRLSSMQGEMKRKDDESSRLLEAERAKAAAMSLEKKGWSDMRVSLEKKLAEAQGLNASMKQELERLRADQERTASIRPDPAIQRENEELRQSLLEQNRTTEEVRRRAQEDLDEMRVLTQRSNAIQLKQKELEDTIETLEGECRTWRNRYARAKTLHSGLRASMQGIPLDHDAAQYVHDKGFIDTNGLIKDVHVTGFQMSIDELLQTARREVPEKVVESMKRVVVSVCRITKELDQHAPQDDKALQQQGKLKAKVSSTANGLITASKNFAAGAGMSPLSILDAAASNLSASIIDLVRVVKIRPTPPGELEQEDDGTITPVDSASLFSPLSTAPPASSRGSLPPPPPFQGLGGAGARHSAESSAYSPISSPRGSVDPYPGSDLNGMANGRGFLHFDKGSNGYGNGRPDDLKAHPYGTYGAI